MFHLPIPIEGNSGVPDSIIYRASRGQEYSILRYHYNIDGAENEPFTVLTDKSHTNVFAYMPPRQTICKHKMETSEYLEGDVIEVKDSIEGTMITFFWNSEANEWNICTRNGVGGDYAYGQSIFGQSTRKKTFREMVLDAFRLRLCTYSSSTVNSSSVENVADPGVSENRPEYTNVINDINDVLALNDLSKSHCYTCILTHSENHIVYNCPFFRASLKLVAVYEIDALPPLVSKDSDIRYNGCVRELSNPVNRQKYLDETKTTEDDMIWSIGEHVFGKSNSPVSYLNTNEDVVHFKRDIFENASVANRNIQSIDLVESTNSVYFPPAWILTNLRTGHRTEIANPFYEQAKDLRNMQPNMMYLYLHLRRNNTINEYLNTFPIYYEKFVMLEREYENFITEVHNAYVKFYILKIRDNAIPKKYFVHAARIHHDIYLPSIATNRIKITRSVVNIYFIQFSITKVIYFMEAEN